MLCLIHFIFLGLFSLNHGSFKKETNLQVNKFFSCKHSLEFSMKQITVTFNIKWILDDSCMHKMSHFFAIVNFPSFNSQALVFCIDKEVFFTIVAFIILVVWKKHHTDFRHITSSVRNQKQVNLLILLLTHG